jgi:hypothetical protein
MLEIHYIAPLWPFTRKHSFCVYCKSYEPNAREQVEEIYDWIRATFVKDDYKLSKLDFWASKFVATGRWRFVVKFKQPSRAVVFKMRWYNE